MKQSRAMVEDALKALRRSEMILSYCRLGAFVLATAGFICWRDNLALAVLPVLVGILLFLLARHHHRRRLKQVSIHERLLTILGESGIRLGGHLEVVRPRTRPAGTPTGLSPQEVEDLDLFAEPVGLYDLLNRTSTALGAGRLASTLCTPLVDRDAILHRQAAVAWLRDRPDQRQLLMAAAAGLRGQDAHLDLFRETVRDAKPLPPLIAHPLVRAWSLVLLMAGLVVVSMAPGKWLVVLLTIGLLNAPLLLRVNRDLLRRIRPWLRLDEVTRCLALLAESASSILPDEGQLGAMRNAFQKAGIRPALPALAGRIPYLFLGYSGMLHTLINALTLWDFHWITALERSYLTHRDAILGAVEALVELEVVLSLSTFSWEQPGTCMPSIRTDGRVLRIEGGRHPLIAPEEVVPNDLDLELPMRVWIITGSNMSGKSTYLRMVGVCSLLAQIGCAVPAEAMALTPSVLLTDLRVRDDLGRHESYFLAEVRQVKRILDHSRAGGALVGLVDEPFRGTNSEERLAAATAVIEALISGSGFFLVATHDRQVTSLADETVVANQHFQETLNEDTLSFDFKIQSGAATVRNAIKVLRVEGYPTEVVESAERIVRELEKEDRCLDPDP